MYSKCTLIILLLCPFYLNAQPSRLVTLVSYGGAANNLGAIFSIDTSGTMPYDIYNFKKSPAGSTSVHTRFVKHANGNLYGFLREGGQNHKGSILEYDPLTDELTVKIEFKEDYQGYPNGDPLLHSNGNIYFSSRYSFSEYDPITNTVKPLSYLNTDASEFGKDLTGPPVYDNNGDLLMIMKGGYFGGGVLVSLDTATHNLTVRHVFNPNGYSNPAGPLIKHPNGKIYGACQYFAPYYCAGIFEFDPTNDSLNVYSSYNNNFLASSISNDLFDGLMLASDGYLYALNGQRSQLFRFDINTHNYTSVAKFNGDTIFGNTSNFIVEVNGKLYFFNYISYSTNNVIVSYELATGIVAREYEIPHGTRGRFISGAFNHNNIIYGTMKNGGGGDYGTIFSFDPVSKNYNILFNCNSTDGINPTSIFPRTNGKFFGTMQGGGPNGTIFEYDVTNAVYTKLYGYGSGGPSIGFPLSDDLSLISNNSGTAGLFLFHKSTNNFDTLNTYNYNLGNQAPLQPAGGLTEYQGDIYCYGTSGNSIHKFDLSTNLFTRLTNIDPQFGMDAQGKLCLASNGKMYGLARNGGSASNGTLFEFDPQTNIITKKIDFSQVISGKNPDFSLIEAPNGKLYGTTQRGGNANAGVLFSYAPLTNTYQKLVQFGAGAYFPMGDLVVVNNTELYGMLNSGGLYAAGGVFKFDINSLITTLVADLGDTTYGGHPNATLCLDGSKMYAITSTGGNGSAGTLMSYDTLTHQARRIESINGSMDGGTPNFNTFYNGKYYGLISDNRGHLAVLYEYDPAQSYHKKYVLWNDTLLGLGISGSTADENGSLYITTIDKGALIQGTGTIIKVDINTMTVTKLHDFDVYNEGWDTKRIFLKDGMLYGAMRAGVNMAGGADVIWKCNPVTSQFTIMDTISGRSVYFGSAEGDYIYGSVSDMSPSGSWYKLNVNTNAFTILHSFSSGGPGGYTCYSPPVLGGDGFLYGVTYQGPGLGYGALCRVDTTGQNFSVLHLFTGIDGGWINDPIYKMGDRIYISSPSTGSGSRGIISEFNITTQTMRTVYDFQSNFPFIGEEHPYGGFIFCTDSAQITTQPVSQTICDHQSEIILTAQASGNYLSTRWYKNGTLLGADNQDTLRFRNFTSVDGVTYMYEVLTRCGYLRSNIATLTYASCDSVYPGDANTNGVVDMNDILNIGLMYGYTGPVRPSATNNFVPQFCSDWNNYNINSTDAKHSDCDGDGVIHQSDTTAVSLNYGLSHVLSRDVFPQLNSFAAGALTVQANAGSFQPGDQVILDIYGGSSIDPLNCYGLAFQLNISPSMIAVNSLQAFWNYTALAPISQLIGLSKVNENTGDVAFGISRTNHADTSTYGQLAKVQFVLSNSITSVTPIDIQWINANANNSSGVLLPLGAGAMPILNAFPLAVNNLSNPNELIVYNNPTSQSLMVEIKGSKYFNGQIRLISMDGKNIAEMRIANQQKVTLNMNNIANGIYLLQYDGVQERMNRKVMYCKNVQ